MLVKFSRRIFDILLLKLMTSLAWHDIFAFAVDFSQMIFSRGELYLSQAKNSSFFEGIRLTLITFKEPKPAKILWVQK